MLKLILATDDGEVLEIFSDKDYDFTRRVGRELLMLDINAEIIKYKARTLYEEQK